LSRKAATLLSSLAARYQQDKRFTREDYHDIESIFNELASFFDGRISMYFQALGNVQASRQLLAALNSLRDIYITDYNSTFQTQVKTADAQGYKAFEQLSATYRNKLKDKRKCAQSSNKLQTMYTHALDVQPKYDAFCAAIAAETGGSFTSAPTKAIFRAVEKTAMRHDADRRFKTDGVLDLVRGALVYKTFAGMHKGLQAIFESKAFNVERMKDRFDNPTDGKLVPPRRPFVRATHHQTALCCGDMHPSDSWMARHRHQWGLGR